MSEYEIFNNDENIQIVPEAKKPKKEKKIAVKETAVKKECCFSKFMKENFKFAYIPVILALFAIFCSLFVKFLPLVSFTVAMLNTVAAFFFIGFASVFAAVITEAICMFKDKNFGFNIKVLLICLAFFVLFI